MTRTLTMMALALGATAALAGPAAAQVVYAQPQVVVPAPVVTYYQPAPVVTVPSVSYYTPPAVSYYAPSAVTYSYYAAPTVTYSAPATVAVPATSVTTRTYRGYGIFRPRGVYTETYVRP